MNAELRETEDRFRSFVTATSEMVYRLNADWSLLIDLKGKALIPDTEEPRADWLDLYVPADEQARVVAAYQEAIAGKKVYAIEHRVIRKDGTEGWVSSRALPILDADGRISSWLGSAADITEAKTYERRQKFLLRLSDKLRPLADPVEMRTVAMRVLGEHLHATRALYFEAEPNGEWLMTIGGYTNQVPPMKERVRMDDFGGHIRSSFSEGKTLVVEDVSKDPRVSAAELEAYDGIGVRAFIAIPLVKGRRIVAVLGIHQDKPHKWSAEDVALSEATAERTWSALEQARAETALRNGEEKYRTLFNSMDQGYCIIRMVYDDAGNAVDWRFLETNPAFHKHNGMPQCVGRTMRELVPDIEQKWVDIYNRVAVTGESLRFEESAAPLERTFDLYVFRVGEPEERKLAVLFTNITARRRAEVALAESERNYQMLFDSIDEGFCTIGMIFDGAGKAVDYRFLQVNESFERQTGLADAEGKRMRELTPRHEELWFETYGKVALTGEPVRFESAAVELGRYFDVYAFRIGEPEDHRVAVLFRDVSERKRREANQELLVRVGDRFGGLENAGETLHSVAEDIGRHFRVRHCLFGDVEGDPPLVTVVHGWDAPGESSLAGEYRLDEFMSPALLTTCLAGELAIVEDTEEDPRVNAGRHLDIGVRSFITVPLLRDGRFTFIVAITHDRPRVWSREDIELMRELTTRIWNRMERARAMEALRASEGKYRSLFETMSQGYQENEIIRDARGNAVDHRVVNANPQFERLTGLRLEDFLNQPTRQVLPDIEPFWTEFLDRVAREGEPASIERQAAPLNRWYSVHAYPMEGGRVAVLYDDITSRKRRELAQELLVSLADRLMAMEDISGTLGKVAEKVGGHFGVRHCMLVELAKDEQGETVFHVWDEEGYLPLAPNKRLEDFLSTEQVRACHEGETTVVVDTRTDARVSAEHYEKSGIRAFVATPLMRDDRCRFLTVVTDDRPRQWAADETDLLRELTDRIWNRLERARAEEALREAEEEVRGSEERLRIALESAGMAAWDWIVEGDTVMWNEGHYHILGLEPGSGHESCEYFMSFVYPDDRAEVGRRLGEAVENGTRFAAEFRIVRRDTGEVRWMSGFGRPLDVREGRTARMTGVMYDVTERKQLTDTLRSAHDRLEVRVGERTRELSEALARLTEESTGRERLEEERHDLLERLVVSQEDERKRISRELHDNLSQHMVAVKLGLGSVVKEIRATELEKMDKLEEVLAELERRVDSLIGAAHRQAWELRPSELDHLGLEVALQHYARVWGEQCGVRVVWDSAGWDEGLRLSAGAEIHLYRVVQEALNNVVRHAGAKKVTLTLESGDGVVLTVEDDGAGFTPAEGTGRLGLIGMRERMTLLGGELEIDSEPGRGSRITLRLPAGVGGEMIVRAAGDEDGYRDISEDV